MKQKNLKRLLPALMITAMCLSIVSCGQKENEPSGSVQSNDSQTEKESEKENSEQAIEKQEEEIPTITMAIFDNNRVYDDTNPAVIYLEENAGVNIEFIILPAGDDGSTKLNLMLANGEYPDVLCVDQDKAGMLNLAKEGIVIPINDLYEEYGVYTKELFEARPQYYAQSIAPDGNMYGFLKVNESFHERAYPKLWYNSEWLESLGMDVPTTTEELKEVLLAAKNSDYNGNGKADEIPLVGATGWHRNVEYHVMNYFIPVNARTMAYAKDGEVIFSCDKEEFRLGLEYLKDLYDNGLISPSTFTNDNIQLQELGRSDEKLVFAFTATHYAAAADNSLEHINRNIAAMPPVESETGARYQQETGYVDMSQTFGLFITDKCQNPEAAFRVADLMYSEEFNYTSAYGAEGEGWWYLDEPVPSGVDGVDVEIGCRYPTTDEEIKYTFVAPVSNSSYEKRAKAGNFALTNEEDHYTSAGFEFRLFEETKKVIDYFYPEYLPINIFIENEEDRETFNANRANLSTYVATSMAQFITGELDLDKDWDAYLENLKKYGVDEYIRIYQDFYTPYYENMQ